MIAKQWLTDILEQCIKSFKTIEEAEKFINGEKIIAGEKTITGMKSSGENSTYAFVDGFIQ